MIKTNIILCGWIYLLKGISVVKMRGGGEFVTFPTQMYPAGPGKKTGFVMFCTWMGCTK